MSGKIRCLAALLTLALLLSGCAAAEKPGAPQTALEKTAAYLQKSVPEPAPGSVGGEWRVLGLARSGLEVPEAYFTGYYDRLCARLDEQQGVLDTRRSTEYSRTILALTALGHDPADAADYDLTAPLGDFAWVSGQGVNGVIWALIALDSGNYTVADSETGAPDVRERYLQALLDAQNEDGSWGLMPGTADADLTAMALQALAAHLAQPEAQAAADRGIAALAQQQEADGGFLAWGEGSSESVAQAIVALSALGISIDDARFIKNSATLSDVLMRFALEDGSFSHTQGGESDQMATEQAFYALTALARAEDGKTALYDMTDVVK